MFLDNGAPSEFSPFLAEGADPWTKLQGEYAHDVEAPPARGWILEDCGEGAGAIWSACRVGGGAAPGSPVAPPSGQEVAGRCSDRFEVAQPEIAMSPGGGVPLLVNVPTWLWLANSGATFPEMSSTCTAVSNAFTVTSTITLAPYKVRWDLGDGTVEGDGPGVPWQRGLPEEDADCAYSYKHTSAGQPNGRFRVTATVVYPGDVGGHRWRRRGAQARLPAHLGARRGPGGRGPGPQHVPLLAWEVRGTGGRSMRVASRVKEARQQCQPGEASERVVWPRPT